MIPPCQWRLAPWGVGPALIVGNITAYRIMAATSNFWLYLNLMCWVYYIYSLPHHSAVICALSNFSLGPTTCIPMVGCHMCICAFIWNLKCRVYYAYIDDNESLATVVCVFVSVVYTIFSKGVKWGWGLSGKLCQFWGVGTFFWAFQGVDLASLVISGVKPP